MQTEPYNLYMYTSRFIGFRVLSKVGKEANKKNKKNVQTFRYGSVMSTFLEFIYSFHVLKGMYGDLVTGDTQVYHYILLQIIEFISRVGGGGGRYTYTAL